jgi:hypothetical protein
MRHIYLSDSKPVFDLSRSPLGTNPVSLFFLTFLIAYIKNIFSSYSNWLTKLHFMRLTRLLVNAVVTENQVGDQLSYCLINP